MVTCAIAVARVESVGCAEAALTPASIARNPIAKGKDLAT
jgi:hypothetical protein